MDPLKIKITTIEALLKKQIKLHVNFTLSDYYKFLYQAALGCEHIIPDQDFSYQHLFNEAAELNYLSSDHPVEQLSPDGKLIRINLRPYISAGGDLKLLNSAFFKTAYQFKGKQVDLINYWREFRAFAEFHLPDISPVQVDQFWNNIKKKDFPPVHHSKGYKNDNKPAYRVVLLELIKEELDQKIQISFPASLRST